MTDRALSEAELSALLFAEEGRLSSAIPDKTEADVFGFRVPGMTVFKRLSARGLLFFTEEDEDEDGFSFTPTVYLTDEGIQVLANYRHS